jgi:hypothetical protein
MGKRPDDSLAKGLKTFLALITILVASVLLSTLLKDTRFGIQISFLVGYTAAVSVFVFYGSRRERGYSVRNRAVQHQLPRLLRIHCLFLAGEVTVLTLALAARPHLPNSWLEESPIRHQSVFTFGLTMIFIFAAAAQINICRRILSRARADS